MTLSDYQQLASRTAGGPHRKERSVLGYYGELHEAEGLMPGDRLTKELGDRLWYLAEICTSHGLELTNEELLKQLGESLKADFKSLTVERLRRYMDEATDDTGALDVDMAVYRLMGRVAGLEQILVMLGVLEDNPAALGAKEKRHDDQK